MFTKGEAKLQGGVFKCTLFFMAYLYCCGNYFHTFVKFLNIF